MEDLIKEIHDDVKTLLQHDAGKEERIKSLESTRRWAFGILGSVMTAIIIATVI